VTPPGYARRINDFRRCHRLVYRSSAYEVKPANRKKGTVGALRLRSVQPQYQHHVDPPPVIAPGLSRFDRPVYIQSQFTRPSRGVARAQAAGAHNDFTPRVNETLATLRDMIHDSRWPQFVRSLEIFSNETQVQLNVLETNRPVARRFFDWCAERIPGWVQGPLDYSAAGAIYRVGARSFFQVNRFLIDRLVETALEDTAGETALDLYAGVGLFSLPLARQFGSVTAVEAGSDSDLRFNAERAGLSLRVEQSTAERFLANLEIAPDFVLLDPPRSGLGKEVVGHLTRLQPRRITVVACDPATLARDLAGLTAAGYSIDRLTLVDLFPQTFHLEAVAHIMYHAPGAGFLLPSPNSLTRK
jgi:hypothetical protein